MSRAKLLENWKVKVKPVLKQSAISKRTNMKIRKVSKLRNRACR